MTFRDSGLPSETKGIGQAHMVVVVFGGHYLFSIAKEVVVQWELEQTGLCFRKILVFFLGDLF